MLTLILFVIGIVLLIKGADLLVAGASSLAAYFGVSALIIGLTVVAFGTSMPELVVNLLASASGNTDIAIGNVIGSNIANILLILGMAAMVYPLTVQKGTVWKEIPFSLLAVLAVAFMANDILLDGGVASVISRIDGLLLLSFFIIFMYYIFGLAAQGEVSATEKPTVYPWYKSVALIVAGIAGLVVGGRWIIEGAVAFATSFGLSEALIGLTIVAVGTSLPELATSVVAAYRRNTDIAIGNVVGSNIFNIFWILGLSAVISPLPFAPALQADVIVCLVATLMLFFALFVGRKHTIERWQGLAFVCLYAAYVVYLVGRG